MDNNTNTVVGLLAIAKNGTPTNAAKLGHLDRLAADGYTIRPTTVEKTTTRKGQQVVTTYAQVECTGFRYVFDATQPKAFEELVESKQLLTYKTRIVTEKGTYFSVQACVQLKENSCYIVKNSAEPKATSKATPKVAVGLAAQLLG